MDGHRNSNMAELIGDINKASRSVLKVPKCNGSDIQYEQYTNKEQIQIILQDGLKSYHQYIITKKEDLDINKRAFYRVLDTDDNILARIELQK